MADDGWERYLRLLREVRGDHEADETAANEDLRWLISADPERHLQRLRNEQVRSPESEAATFEASLSVALRQRDYREAARLLPGVLARVPDIWTLVAEQPGMNQFESLSPGALAAAALFPDEQTDRALEAISTMEVSPNVAAFAKMLDLRKAAQAVLAAVSDGPLPRDVLRSRSDLVGRTYSNAVQWLQKAALITEAHGIITAGGTPPASAPPVEQDTPEPVAVSEGGVPVRLVDLNDFPRAAGDSQGATARPERLTLERVPDPVSPATFVPTAPAERPAGQAQVLVTAHTTWLLTWKQPPAEPRRVWSAAVHGRDGAVQQHLVLPAPVRSWVAGPDRDWVCQLDEDHHLRVYREGGDLLTDVHLSAIPEVGAAVTAAYPVRADFDVTTDRLLVTAGAEVWMLTPGAEPWGRRMPAKVYPSGGWGPGETPARVRALAKRFGLREDLTAREAVSHLDALGLTSRDETVVWPQDATNPTFTVPAAEFHMHLGEITPDAIYAARLTRTGATVSTRYGLNVDFNTVGDVERLCWTDGTLRTLAEDGASRIGATAHAVVRVADDVITTSGCGEVAAAAEALNPVHEVAEVEGEPVAGPGWVAAVSGPILTVVNTESGLVRAHQLPKKPSAFLRAGGTIRVHVGTKHTVLDV